MVSNIADLKELILWAKEQRVKSLSINGVTVEFSELAFVGSFADLGEAKNDTLEQPLIEPDGEIDDDLLFHSSQG